MTRLVNSMFERHSLQRVSGWLASACLVLIVVFIVILPLLVLVYWTAPDLGLLAVRVNMLPINMQTAPQDWQRLSSAALTCIPVMFMVRGLWEARLCFKQFATGQVFTTLAVQRLRSFAGWIMASSLASILIGPALYVVLTFSNTAGTRQVAMGISTDQIMTLLFAAIVWVMAAVIAQGQALADENSSFV